MHHISGILLACEIKGPHWQKHPQDQTLHDHRRGTHTNTMGDALLQWGVVAAVVVLLAHRILCALLPHLHIFIALDGPRQQPVLGNTLQMAKRQGFSHLVVKDWVEQFGSLFRVRFLHRSVCGGADCQGKGVCGGAD